MKSKWIAFFVFFCLFLVPALQTRAGAEAASQIRWYSYPEGMALSKEQGKKVFLHFWAEWCAYCTKMAKETFVDPAVIDYLNQAFISIKVDYDREKKITSEYAVRGLPYSFFLSEAGDTIGGRPGFISAADLLSTLKYIGSGSYKTMTLKTFLKGK